RFDPEVNTILLNPRARIDAGYDSAIDWCDGGDNRCTAATSGRTIRCAPVAVASERPYHAATKLEVKYLDAALLSVRFEQDGDGGGAHPFYGVAAINIDLTTGAFVAPERWLTPEAATIDWLAFTKERDKLSQEMVSLRLNGDAANVRDDFVKTD